jgi:hypothetical protein
VTNELSFQNPIDVHTSFYKLRPSSRSICFPYPASERSPVKQTRVWKTKKKKLKENKKRLRATVPLITSYTDKVRSTFGERTAQLCIHSCAACWSSRKMSPFHSVIPLAVPGGERSSSSSWPLSGGFMFWGAGLMDHGVFLLNMRDAGFMLCDVICWWVRAVGQSCGALGLTIPV